MLGPLLFHLWTGAAVVVGWPGLSAGRYSGGSQAHGWRRLQPPMPTMV